MLLMRHDLSLTLSLIGQIDKRTEQPTSRDAYLFMVAQFHSAHCFIRCWKSLWNSCIKRLIKILFKIQLIISRIPSSSLSGCKFQNLSSANYPHDEIIKLISVTSHPSLHLISKLCTLSSFQDAEYSCNYQFFHMNGAIERRAAQRRL